MAAYNSNDDDMLDDSSKAAPESDNPKADEEGSSMALLPKDFFQGKDLKPGVVCKVKVEKVMDDQVSVSYVPHEAKEKESDEEEMGMARGDTELEEMMA